MTFLDGIRRRQLLGCLALPAIAPLAQAATYPTRPIRVIVPFPPASIPTVLLRSISVLTEPDLGVPFVIDNKPGGNTFIGMGAGASAEPDGYTLVQTASAIDVLHPVLYSKLPYDPARLVPLTVIGSSPYVVIVPAQLNVNSLAELVELIRAKPGGYNYASAGIGGPGHLFAQKFEKEAGLKMEHVQFAGSAPVHLSMMRADVHLYFDVLNSALPKIQEGRFKALAVGMETRYPGLPDVPTLDELGHPGYLMMAWYGLRAPRGTPQAAIDRLMEALNKALGNQALRDQYAAVGLLVGTPGKPQDMSDRIATERARWAPILREFNVRLE
ncbi:Bug family tripartite tricarboxylate transporter substrate binding protein [Pseudorhodoferax sp.]|uniref:Bug family tripartite tricarboxylate transporter substrate binding protein n=1 Tax=Pseudorhodoferax sp. TaxID=1993553 RepID=UPI002DD674CB|nr:tripartite tricarboxylate transporter substrate binding protein [Pseudorhodoferax sp.]